jgi:uncharacterized protein YihD (DUF1040 family)
MMTTWEKTHAPSVLASVNEHLVMMNRIEKLAEENGWKDLAKELESKIMLMEIRSRQLTKHILED